MWIQQWSPKLLILSYLIADDNTIYFHETSFSVETLISPHTHIYLNDFLRKDTTSSRATDRRVTRDKRQSYSERPALEGKEQCR